MTAVDECYICLFMLVKIKKKWNQLSIQFILLRRKEPLLKLMSNSFHSFKLQEPLSHLTLKLETRKVVSCHTIHFKVLSHLCTKYAEY